MELMNVAFEIVQSIILKILDVISLGATSQLVLQKGIIKAVNNCNYL